MYKECMVEIAEEAALYYADANGGYDDMVWWLDRWQELVEA